MCGEALGDSSRGNKIAKQIESFLGAVRAEEGPQIHADQSQKRACVNWERYF